MTTKPKRHRWGEANVISAHKTERACLHDCGIVKVTRHETEAGRDVHWVEYWRGLDQVSGGRTPVCEAVEVDA